MRDIPFAVKKLQIACNRQLEFFGKSSEEDDLIADSTQFLRAKRMFRTVRVRTLRLV